MWGRAAPYAQGSDLPLQHDEIGRVLVVWPLRHGLPGRLPPDPGIEGVEAGFAFRRGMYLGQVNPVGPSEDQTEDLLPADHRHLVRPAPSRQLMPERERLLD